MTNLPANGIAGQETSFTVVARDRFSNLIDTIFLDVTYAGSGTASSDAGVAVVGPAATGTGAYPVRYLLVHLVFVIDCIET